jgi:hypothetical protein
MYLGRSERYLTLLLYHLVDVCNSISTFLHFSGLVVVGAQYDCKKILRSLIQESNTQSKLEPL